MVDAYTLTLTALMLTAGSLADRFGRRLLFMAAGAGPRIRGPPSFPPGNGVGGQPALRVM